MASSTLVSSLLLIIALVFFVGSAQSTLYTLTATNIQNLLDAHNGFRANVNPPAVVPLTPFTWDTALQASAEAVAGTCVYGHSNTSNGENIAGGSTGFYPTLGWELVVTQQWGNETTDYDIVANTCAGSTCLHYTQIVWDRTYAIGCGRSDNCPVFPQTFIVCQYIAAGNNGSRPYTFVQASASKSPAAGVSQSSQATASNSKSVVGGASASNSKSVVGVSASNSKSVVAGASASNSKSVGVSASKSPAAGVSQSGAGVSQSGSGAGVSQSSGGVSQSGAGVSQSGSAAGVTQSAGGVSQSGAGVSQSGSAAGVSQSAGGVSQSGASTPSATASTSGTRKPGSTASKTVAASISSSKIPPSKTAAPSKSIGPAKCRNNCALKFLTCKKTRRSSRLCRSDKRLCVAACPKFKTP